MDVIEIAENLRHDPFARGSIRDLLLHALGGAFRTWEEEMEESEERLSQLEAEGEDTSDEWAEWLGPYAEYKDLLGILAALGGNGGSDPVDGMIDCAAIEKIIQERRERISGVSAPRAASLPTQQKVLNFASRRGRPFGYRWQDFAAEMVRHSLEAPITDQASFERYMAQWCADNWETSLPPRKFVIGWGRRSKPFRSQSRRTPVIKSHAIYRRTALDFSAIFRPACRIIGRIIGLQAAEFPCLSCRPQSS